MYQHNNIPPWAAGTGPSRGLSRRCRTLDNRQPVSERLELPLRWYGTEPPPDGLALGTLRRIVGLLRPYWRRVAVAFVLGAAMMGITTFIPLIVRTIIDEGLTRRVPGVLGREVGLLVLLAL